MARNSSSPLAEHGQASVEFVGALPAMLVVALIGWQLVLTGHTAWLCANAARVGARAALVGKDPARAARSALPDALEPGLEVASSDGARVKVSLRVPLLIHRFSTPLAVSAATTLGPAP